MGHSSATPVPSTAASATTLGSSAPRLIQGQAPQRIGAAGLIVIFLSALGEMASRIITAAGGAPEAVKWITTILKAGWPAALALVACSIVLFAYRVLVNAIDRAEHAEERAAAAEGRAIRRDEQFSQHLKDLKDHTQEENAAHASQGQAMAKLTRAITRLEHVMGSVPTQKVHRDDVDGAPEEEEGEG